MALLEIPHPIEEQKGLLSQLKKEDCNPETHQELKTLSIFKITNTYQILNKIKSFINVHKSHTFLEQNTYNP